jgi:hypothetical protein
MGLVARTIFCRRIAVGLVEQGGKLITQVARGGRGVVGDFLVGLMGKPGGDFQGFAGIGKSHLVQVVKVSALEIALGRIKDGLGQGVLTVAEGFGPGGGIEACLAVHVVFGLGMERYLLKGASFDAIAPGEIVGQALDGAQGGADFPGDGGVSAAGAEF